MSESSACSCGVKPQKTTVSRPGKVFLAMVSRPFWITTFSGQPPRKMPAERMQEPTLFRPFSGTREVPKL